LDRPARVAGHPLAPVRLLRYGLPLVLGAAAVWMALQVLRTRRLRAWADPAAQRPVARGSVVGTVALVACTLAPMAVAVRQGRVVFAQPQAYFEHGPVHALG